MQANKKHLSLGASCTSTLRRVDSVSLPAVTLLLFFHSMSTKKLDPQLGIAMDWNFNIIINEYMTCLVPMSFNLGSELKPRLNVKKICLQPTSFNLGSEQKLVAAGLTPMSFQLGSELKEKALRPPQRLAPTSIQLGSEPLFPNLYLIVT